MNPEGRGGMIVSKFKLVLIELKMTCVENHRIMVRYWILMIKFSKK